MRIEQYQVAFPLAIPLSISNTITSSTNSFNPIKCAKVPPIWPAPINDIFFDIFYYFIVGIINSGLDLMPDGHLEVIVLSLV